MVIWWPWGRDYQSSFGTALMIIASKKKKKRRRGRIKKLTWHSTEETVFVKVPVRLSSLPFIVIIWPSVNRVSMIKTQSHNYITWQRHLMASFIKSFLCLLQHMEEWTNLGKESLKLDQISGLLETPEDGRDNLKEKDGQTKEEWWYKQYRMPMSFRFSSGTGCSTQIDSLLSAHWLMVINSSLQFHCTLWACIRSALEGQLANRGEAARVCYMFHPWNGRGK